MSSDELTTISKVTVLRERIAHAKRLGFRIRSEWLGGETGGGCEIAGVRWVFLDLSLSVDEQLGQLSDALATLTPAPAAQSSAAQSSAAQTSAGQTGAGQTGAGQTAGHPPRRSGR